MELDGVLKILKEEFPNKAIDVFESLELLKESINGAVEVIAKKVNNTILVIQEAPIGIKCPRGKVQRISYALNYFFSGFFYILNRGGDIVQQIKEIRPGIAVIIFNDKNEVLLQKRADVGLWGIPSGHVEPGETITNAAVREVFEETGLHVKILRLIGVYSDPKSQVFKYPDGRVTHFVTCCFQGEVIGGKISCDSPETLEVKFFPIDILPSNIIKMNPNWLNDALSNKVPYVR